LARSLAFARSLAIARSPRPYFTCPVVKFIRKFLLRGIQKWGFKIIDKKPKKR